MPWSHVLELKMHTASSSLIRSNNSQQMYRNCFIEARTADGQYKKISLDEIKTNTLLTDEFLRLSPGTRAAVGEEGKQFPITVSFKNDRTQLLIPPNVAKLANKRFQEDYKHDSFVQLKFVIPGYYPAQSTTKQKQNSHEREAEPVTPQRLPSTDKGKNDSDDEDGGGSGRRKSMFNMNPMNMNIPKTPFHMPNMNMPKINMPKMNMNMPKMNMSNMKVPGFQGKQPEPERRTSFETPEKAPQESEQVRPKKRTEPLTQYNTQLESAISLPLEKIKYSHLEEQSQWFFPSGTTAYSLYLHIKAMQNLFPIDTSGFSDPYFYVYFADQNGHPIMPYDTHKSNINMTKILTVGLLQGNEVAQKNGYPYKSPVIPRTLSPNWNLDIKFSSEDLPAEMSNAMYILITIWDSNTLKSDASMGEVYIPISSAYTLKSPSKTYIPVISNKNIKTYSIQPTKTIQAKKLSPKTSFGIMTGSLSKVEFTTSDANDGEMIVVKLASQLRMLTSTDCAWPCRVLNVSFTGGLEEDIFHVFLGHEGLHLSSSPGASSKSKAASARMNVLRSCVEALPLEEGVHMVIPYSHIDLSATHILADNMLLVGLFIQRVVGNRVAGSNHIEKLREVPLDVIVSPCLAHDMYCFIQSRVSVNDVRQSLTEAMYTSEEEQDKIARVVQSELLATIETIEAVSMEGRGVLEDTLRLSFLQEKDEVSTSSDPGAGGVVKRSEYGMRTANKYTLALRYLTIKKSFYQLYLQYYIQYSILVGELDGAASKLPEVIFSAETISQITMRTKMILNGEETEAEDEDDGGDRAVDHVSLVQRLQVIMEHMDKDVRALIFQQIRQSTEVSAASNIEKTTKLLSQLIYDQYLLIIAYINSVLSEKGSKAVLKNEESKGVVRALIPGTGMVKNMFNSVGIGKKDDKIAAASINGAQVELDQAELDKNPQRKRDLIRFILTQDNLFEIHLSANLHSCSYRFSSRPVLSKCVDFDDLISKFYVLLNENLQMWNNRTLQHFKKVRDGSQNSFVPWELVALMDQKSGKELISSEIPETVQSQLNTQIGLKKIPVDFGNLSSLSLKRVIKINYKISSSIAKAYINIAGEYERVLNEKMLQLQKTATVVKRGVLRNLAHKSGLSLATNVLIVGPTRLLLTGSLATGSATGSTTSDGSDEEEIMAFLMSVANDSRRIRLIHIPESIASFDSGVASNLEKSLFTNTEYTSMLSSNQLLFSNAITTFESVTKHAMNALANQLIFNCADVRSFILEGFEEYLSKMLKLYNTPSKFSSFVFSLISAASYYCWNNLAILLLMIV